MSLALHSGSIWSLSEGLRSFSAWMSHLHMLKLAVREQYKKLGMTTHYLVFEEMFGGGYGPGPLLAHLRTCKQQALLSMQLRA